jgi:hypothetical protein
MTTILLMNAVSSLLAVAGVGGYVARRTRRARRQAVVRWLYVSR